METHRFDRSTQVLVMSLVGVLGLGPAAAGLQITASKGGVRQGTTATVVVETTAALFAPFTRMVAGNGSVSVRSTTVVDARTAVCVVFGERAGLDALHVEGDSRTSAPVIYYSDSLDLARALDVYLGRLLAGAPPSPARNQLVAARRLLGPLQKAFEDPGRARTLLGASLRKARQAQAIDPAWAELEFVLFVYGLLEEELGFIDDTPAECTVAITRKPGEARLCFSPSVSWKRAEARRIHRRMKEETDRINDQQRREGNGLDSKRMGAREFYSPSIAHELAEHASSWSRGFAYADAFGPTVSCAALGQARQIEPRLFGPLETVRRWIARFTLGNVTTDSDGNQLVCAIGENRWLNDVEVLPGAKATETYTIGFTRTGRPRFEQYLSGHTVLLATFGKARFVDIGDLETKIASWVTDLFRAVKRIPLLKNIPLVSIIAGSELKTVAIAELKARSAHSLSQVRTIFSRVEPKKPLTKEMALPALQLASHTETDRKPMPYVHNLEVTGDALAVARAARIAYGKSVAGSVVIVFSWGMCYGYETLDKPFAGFRRTLVTTVNGLPVDVSNLITSLNYGNRSWTGHLDHHIHAELDRQAKDWRTSVKKNPNDPGSWKTPTGITWDIANQSLKINGGTFPGLGKIVERNLRDLLQKKDK